MINLLVNLVEFHLEMRGYGSVERLLVSAKFVDTNTDRSHSTATLLLVCRECSLYRLI